MGKIFEVTSVHRGDDTRVAKMCLALEQAGRTVAVAALTDGSPIQSQGRWRILSYGRSSRNRLARILQQPRLWRLLCRENPDAIQFHDPELIPLMLWLAGRNGRKRKIVYDMHEDVAASLRDRGCPGVVARGYEILLRLAERRVWITLAEDCYGGLVARPWPVIHNYPCWDRTETPRRERQVVYVGDVAKGRGAFDMLRAFARAELSDWRLAIVGPCNEPGTDQRLAAEAAELHLGRRFLRVGRVPPAGVSHWLNASSIGFAVLHPLRNYLGCPPGKVFEYALAGLPAIVSDFPSYRSCFGVLPSVVFVNPLDIGAVASALRQVAGNPERFEALCAASRKIAAERYVWSSEALRVGRMFDLLLGGRAAL